MAGAIRALHREFGLEEGDDVSAREEGLS